MTRKDGKSRDAEMRMNDIHRNPAGTGASRFQASDSSGTSSSRSRSTQSGAERAESASSGRGGANPSGASSAHADKYHEPHTRKEAPSASASKPTGEPRPPQSEPPEQTRAPARNG